MASRTWSPIKRTHDQRLEDLHRHEEGCAVRGCDSPDGFTRIVEIHGDGSLGKRTVVLGYCKEHLDELTSFKARKGQVWQCNSCG